MNDKYTVDKVAEWLCTGQICGKDRCKVLAEDGCPCTFAGNNLKRLSAESAWKPVDDTTPKDRSFLLYANFCVELGHFNTMLGDWVANWDHRPLKQVTHYKDVCFPLPDWRASNRLNIRPLAVPGAPEGEAVFIQDGKVIGRITNIGGDENDSG